MSAPDPFSDAVKRIKAEMDMQAVLGNFGWVAVKLEDGSPADHVAYPRRQDAVKHMRHDRDRYLYLEIQPDGMTEQEAKAVLKYARVVHSLGFRIPDPEFDYDATMPAQKWDRRAMAGQLASGRPLDPNGYTNLPSERHPAHG